MTIGKMPLLGKWLSDLVDSHTILLSGQPKFLASQSNTRDN